MTAPVSAEAPGRIEFSTTDSGLAIDYLSRTYRTSLRVTGARDGHLFRHSAPTAACSALTMCGYPCRSASTRSRWARWSSPSSTLAGWNATAAGSASGSFLRRVRGCRAHPARHLAPARGEFADAGAGSRIAYPGCGHLAEPGGWSDPVHELSAQVALSGSAVAPHAHLPARAPGQHSGRRAAADQGQRRAAVGCDGPGTFPIRQSSTRPRRIAGTPPVPPCGGHRVH